MAPSVIDDAALEMNVLTFREKSFSFERAERAGETEYLVFVRTEVESESRFRPKLVKLKVLVPREKVLGDLASDTLVLAPDGQTPGPRSTGTAQEVSADESEFREQGIHFRRAVRSDGVIVYLPDGAPPALRDSA